MRPPEAKILELRSAITYQDYSEGFKASIIAAVEANNGNVSATAKLFNISRDTVYYWWRRSARYCEIQAPSSISLADKLENIAHSTADSIAEHDLSIVTLADKGRLLGVVVPQMQLLRGLPTAITADLERTELTVILQSSLSAGLETVVNGLEPADKCHYVSDSDPQVL